MGGEGCELRSFEGYKSGGQREIFQGMSGKREMQGTG